jgi:hypothetical protein
MNSRRFTSDHLIGQQACGNIETERLAGFEIASE